MLGFFSKSFFFVSIYSIVRFFVGLLIARFLFPADFATILIPVILFGFLDMYIEGGYYSGILKKGITRNQESLINKEQLKSVIFLGFVVLTCITFFSFINQSREIPFLVTFVYFLNSLTKVFIYTKEAIFVASGRYILVETISFLTSCFIYAIVFLSIFLTEIPGYYYLCIWHLGFTISFAITIQLYGKKYITNENTGISELKTFSKINRNSSIIFTVNGRIDELSASTIFSSSALGIFSKIKELAIMIGTFSSKIISRPWFYIACNSKEKFIAIFHTLAILVILFGSWILMPLINIVIDYVISIMGDNWDVLNEFSHFIIYIFIIYLCTEFSRCSLVASGGERFVLNLEKSFLIIRCLLYPIILFLVSIGQFELDINLILVIEVLMRVIYFSLQSIYLIFNLGKKIITT